jgi:hypothetical protein
MSSTHEVISALLDDQPFDRQQLADALNDPAGRALLIDLATLRRMVQPVEAAPDIKAFAPARRSPWRVVAAAAMLVLALGGGYLAGGRRAVTTTSEAPPATRVVEAVPFVPSGGMR